MTFENPIWQMKDSVSEEKTKSLTIKPKKLSELEEVSITTPYDPAEVMRLLQPTEELQTITVYGPPLFIGPNNVPVYRARDVHTFKGYLHRFQPLQMQVAFDDEDEPLMTIAVTPEPNAEVT